MSSAMGDPLEYDDVADEARHRREAAFAFQDPLLTVLTKTRSVVFIDRATCVSWIHDVGLINSISGTKLVSILDELCPKSKTLGTLSVVTLQLLSSLAVVYFDAVLDMEDQQRQQRQERQEPQEPQEPQQRLKLIPGSSDTQLMALVCYLAAAKHSFLHEGDAHMATRNMVKYLFGTFGGADGGTTNTENAIREKVQTAEVILWSEALSWRGWRPTAAEWLARVAQKFELPDAERLMHALPVLLLDVKLARECRPSMLALAIVLASVVGTANGDLRCRDELAMIQFLSPLSSSAAPGNAFDHLVALERIWPWMLRVGYILRIAMSKKGTLIDTVGSTERSCFKQSLATLATLATLGREDVVRVQWTELLGDIAREAWTKQCLVCDKGLALLFPLSPPLVCDLVVSSEGSHNSKGIKRKLYGTASDNVGNNDNHGIESKKQRPDESVCQSVCQSLPTPTETRLDAVTSTGLVKM